MTLCIFIVLLAVCPCMLICLQKDYDQKGLFFSSNLLLTREHLISTSGVSYLLIGFNLKIYKSSNCLQTSWVSNWNIKQHESIKFLKFSVKRYQWFTAWLFCPFLIIAVEQSLLSQIFNLPCLVLNKNRSESRLFWIMIWKAQRETDKWLSEVNIKWRQPGVFVSITPLHRALYKLRVDFSLKSFVKFFINQKLR